MKHILLLAWWTISLLAVSLPARGQADDSRRSRPGSISPGIGRLPYALPAPTAASTREVKVNRSVAVNRYYRNLTRGKAAVPAAAAPIVAAENARTADNITDTDLLFTGEKIRVSNLYPNPATDYVYLDYQLQPGAGNVRIAFYSPLGARLSDYVLIATESRFRISTQELPNGIYFYQLSVEGRTLATKKLLVRH